MIDSEPSQPETTPTPPAPAGIVPSGLPFEMPQPAPADDEASFDIHRYLAALARHKWLVIVLTLVGTTAGIVASRVIPSQYLAQATLWISVESGEGGSRQGPIQPAELLQWSSWVDLLRSFVVLDEVVRRQHVYLEPDNAADSAAFTGFQLKPSMVPGDYSLDVARDGHTITLTTSDRVIQRGQVGDSIGPAVGFEWRPGAAQLWAGRTLRFGVRTPRDAALKLRTNLNAVLPERGSFLRLELTGVSPSLTAGTVNGIAERFVEVAAQLKRQKLTELSAILQQQLTSSYTDLGRAENALEGFRVHTITLPSEQASPVTPGLEQTRDPVFRAFFEMRVDRDQVERDRQAILSALAQPDSGVSAMQLEGIASVRASAELSQALSTLASKEAEQHAMSLQFAGTYPPLQRLTAEVVDLRRRTIPSLAQNLVTELTSRLQDMDSRIGSASHELQAIPARAIEEARLRRDVTIAENLYTTLQQRYEEARLAEVSSIPDVRILDRAVAPEHPVRNKGLMFLLAGIFGGLGSAAGLVLMLDRFDRRLRYPDQVTRDMGLPILGVLPRLRNGGRGVAGGDETQVVESLRTIRLNLEHAYGAAGPLVTTITSPGAGDGKSFLASNLAVSFAEAGHRTIVIDADIRRGTLHRVFSAQRKPGLLDYLTGAAALDKVVQATAISGVEFIGGGTRKAAGPELLASAAMSQLLIGLRATYGVIIIDAAPLGAGVDPLILGSLTGNLVLVVRSGVTDQAFAMAKLADIGRLPIRVLGAVINDVKPGQGYGTYAYYGYIPGYETAEEKEPPRAAVKRLPGKG